MWTSRFRLLKGRAQHSSGLGYKQNEPAKNLEQHGVNDHLKPLSIEVGARQSVSWIFVSSLCQRSLSSPRDRLAHKQIPSRSASRPLETGNSAMHALLACSSRPVVCSAKPRALSCSRANSIE